MRLILLFIMIAMLGACDQLTGENTGAFTSSNESLIIGGSDSLQISQGNYLLGGVMSNGGRAGHNFNASFDLSLGETLTLTLGSDRSLSGGLELNFSRENDGLYLNASLNSKSHRYLLIKAKDISSTSFSFSIDIHNDHTDLHFLIWYQSGPFADNFDCSNDGGCLYNSEDFALDQWLGVGRTKGANWGLKNTNRNRVTELRGPLAAISDA